MKHYHFKSCGLDYVYLKNGFTYHETSHGKGVSIENVEGLYRAITRFVCMNKPELDGKEVRFLRKRLDLTQAGLASIMGVDKQTVARWEKDQCEMPIPAQRLLRVYCLEKQNDNSPIHEVIEHINSLEDADGKIFFKEKNDEWLEAA